VDWEEGLYGQFGQGREIKRSALGWRVWIAVDKVNSSERLYEIRLEKAFWQGGGKIKVVHNGCRGGGVFTCDLEKKKTWNGK